MTMRSAVIYLINFKAEKLIEQLKYVMIFNEELK